MGYPPAQTTMLRGLRDGKPMQREGMVYTSRKTGERVAVPYHRDLWGRLRPKGNELLMPYVTSATGRMFEGRWFSRRFELWRAALVTEGWDVGHKMTCHEKFPPLGARVRPEKGTDDEAIKIFGRADHWDFARA